jgi:predicted  nucleic acid-binding Zn-ribbon protein
MTSKTLLHPEETFKTPAPITLLHPKETFTIPALQAMTKCRLFQNNPTLLLSPYRVESPVSLGTFQNFVSALKGNSINPTGTDLTELHQLCEEFGFTEIASKLSEFGSSMDFKEENADGNEGIAEQTDYIVGMLQDKVAQQSTNIRRLVMEVLTLRSAAAEIPALKAQIGQKQIDQVLEQLSREFSELRNEVLTQTTEVKKLFASFGNVTNEVSTLQSSTTKISTLSHDLYALKTQIAQKVNDSVVEELLTELSELREEVSVMKNAEKKRDSVVEELSTKFRELRNEVSVMKIAKKESDSVVEKLSTELSELRKEVLILKARIPAVSPTFTGSKNHRLDVVVGSSVVGFSDHFGLSGDLRRVSRKAIFASVAGQS